MKTFLNYINEMGESYPTQSTSPGFKYFSQKHLIPFLEQLLPTLDERQSQTLSNMIDTLKNMLQD